MDSGCYTAIVTPFKEDKVDYEGLAQLVDFQITNGITGVLAAGTTGESPTLKWEEHNKVVEFITEMTKGRCLSIAGTGSNNTAETLDATEHALKAGADALLLVDPYYNGPSSLEIRREYVAPVAAAYPQMEIIPYVIPGRTGCQLLPADLALLFKQYPNVSSVKEATTDLENMRRTRTCCGETFTILSGDDGMTFQMMADPQIKAAGVISVASNVAPGAVTRMVQLLAAGNRTEAEKLCAGLDPLFNLVTVKTKEQTPYGEVDCRARNPLAYKTLMQILGMPSGPCRQPLGKMSAAGLQKVLAAAKAVQVNHPHILKPVADFFGVDIEARLNNSTHWEGLSYESY